jgi:hypothetical protein
MDLDALLTRCRLADGRIVDIGIAPAGVSRRSARTRRRRCRTACRSSISAAIWYCPVSSMVTCTSTRP